VSVVFFTDRDLGRLFPETLRLAGCRVERHADHFTPTASDELWLAHVGRQGWCAVTHDARIRYKPNELAAVVRHRVPLLVVVGKAPLPQLARHFVTTLPRIHAFLREHEPPFIAKVYRPAPSILAENPNASGVIDLWYPR
jgi:PIN like domain